MWITFKAYLWFYPCIRSASYSKMRDMDTEIKKAAAMLGRKGGKKTSTRLKERLGPKKTSQHFSELVRLRWDRLRATKRQEQGKAKGTRRPAKSS
jgi:hypothetical protein